MSTSRSRPTIGLLVGNTWHPIAWDVWAGVNDVTEERDVNLLCFAGEDLNPPLDYFSQANVLYDLVSEQSVDGLVIWGGGLGQYVKPEEIEVFCQQYQPLPMVNAALPMQNIPTVLVDNYQGVRDIMLHLVHTHNYRKIAFISGPQDHPEAQARYQAYCDALMENGITPDKQLFAPGDFNPDSGAAAIDLLLDERQLLPGADIQAIVVADDGMAMSAMTALQARGIQVPDHIAVTGFDNVEEGWYTKPTLTSVPVLVYEQARKATELVLAQINGETVPPQTIIPTRAILRESCGCLTPTLTRTPADVSIELTDADTTLETVLLGHRDEILAEMRQAMEAPSLRIVPTEVEQLLDAFWAELKGRAPDTFIPTLDGILRRGNTSGGSIAAWQNALTIMYNHTIPFLSSPQAKTKAEILTQQAQVTIGETAERIQVNWRVQVEQRTGMVNVVSQELISTFDIPKLTDMAAGGFHYLGIPASYLVLYEDPKAPTSTARLIMGYNQDGRLSLQSEGRPFRAKELLPDGIFPQDKRYSMVVEPLYFQDEQLGFVLFDAKPREALFYDALRGNLSSAIKGALVVEQHRQAETRLATIHSLGQKLVLSRNVNQIASLVVNAAQKVLQYPIFSLWLAHEKEGELVHWTQSANAEKEIPHILLDEEKSIIATVIRTGEVIYLPDVSQDARYLSAVDRFGSELCIPLKVGDQVIGALNTESRELDYFDAADIQVLEALANTAAIAIHNARMHEQALQRTERLTAANRTAQAAIKELEAFAYSVSHDLRAPLRSINGFSLALKEDYAHLLDAEGLDLLSRVRTASQRMGELIDGMLQLSRLTRGELEHTWVNMSALANNIVNEMEKTEPQRQVDFIATPDLVALGDARLIRVMLENLLHNAWKFTQQQVITRIEFGRCEQDGQTVYCISDNGVGFDMNYADKLFKAFQRLHAMTDFEGTGIGLATVQRIVNRHGGQVWAESAPGQGATFYFTLPSQENLISP